MFVKYIIANAINRHRISRYLYSRWFLRHGVLPFLMGYEMMAINLPLGTA